MYPDPQRLPEGSKTRPVRADRIMHEGLRRCHLVRDDLNLRLQEYPHRGCIMYYTQQTLSSWMYIRVFVQGFRVGAGREAQLLLL